MALAGRRLARTGAGRRDPAPGRPRRGLCTQGRAVVAERALAAGTPVRRRCGSAVRGGGRRERGSSGRGAPDRVTGHGSPPPPSEIVMEIVSESEVLDRLRPGLGGHVPAEDLDTLVVLRTGPSRRRSSLYFVGIAGDETCRWVVKRPTSESHQDDLTSPLPAPQQFSALQRLHAHLLRLDEEMSTPRPLGLLPEINAYVM